MQALIVYSGALEGESSASADNQDTLMQVAEISNLLKQMEINVKEIALIGSIGEIEHYLMDNPPDFIFNLVETLRGTDGLIYLAAGLFESLHIPYTGCSALCLALLSSKIRQKKLLTVAGLLTADFVTGFKEPNCSEGPWIVKSDTEHASVGMSAESVVETLNQAKCKISEMEQRLKGVWFAEQFIEGREFNVALLEQPHDQPQVLPIAEIKFVNFPEKTPKIVDYAAKWEVESFAYTGTQRHFDLCLADKNLFAELGEMALKCWDLFQLQGAARVDFRVDSQGRPWILEVNPNPCLSSDAGFMAAAAQADLSPSTVIQQLIAKFLPNSLYSQPKMLFDERKFNKVKEVPANEVLFRREVNPNDVEAIRQLVQRSGVFSAEEVTIAGELVEEAFLNGEQASGYSFIFAERAGNLLGYSCFGQVPLTEKSYDLYWIAVDNQCFLQGIAKKLLDKTIEVVIAMGGGQIYAETSSMDSYQPARSFYHKTGFEECSRQKNFYKDGDDKVTFVKWINN